MSKVFSLSLCIGVCVVVYLTIQPFIVVLQHAKRASEAPLLRKIGIPSSLENLVMTSP